MLAGENLKVRRGGRLALNAVSVQARPGAVTAVVGPNGAGKSTLIAGLTGLLPLEGGRATLDGTPLSQFKRQTVARRVAVLPQQYRATFPFKAFEIVAMGRSPYEGMESDAEAARHVEAALYAADVAHLADRPIDRLSGGERQRVFLARALAQILPLPTTAEARYLLLDEPTASLDLRHQTIALDFARKAARDGAGVLTVLHDLNLAARFADDAIVMSEGVVAARGAPADIFNGDVLRPIYGAGISIFSEPADGKPVVLPAGPNAL